MSEINPFGGQSAARLTQSLMLGLSRNPFPDASPPPLTALSLISVWKGCAEPVAPALSGAGERLTERQAFLSDDSRRALIRLLSGRKQADGEEISRAALRAVSRNGLALHPFDYARLEEALTRHAAELNAAERAWLSAVRPERELPEAAYDGPPVSEETLADAGKQAKLGFLRRLRAEQPGKARILLASLFSSEAAAMRGSLLEILALNPDIDDAPFLTELANDRAATVREAAEKILGRIAGTSAFDKRIERLRERLSVKTEGIILRKKVLAFSKTASAKPHEVINEQTELLEGLRLHDVAQALGESENSLMDIAARTDKLRHAAFLLLVKAAEAGRFDLVKAHAGLLEDADGRASIEFLAALAPSADAAARRAVAELVLKPERWSSFPAYGAGTALLSFFDGPAPQDLARRLLDMPAWSRAEPALLETQLNHYAPLFPAGLSAEFLARFGDAAPRAAEYHQFLLTLAGAPK